MSRLGTEITEKFMNGGFDRDTNIRFEYKRRRLRHKHEP